MAGGWDRGTGGTKDQWDLTHLCCKELRLERADPVRGLVDKRAGREGCRVFIAVRSKERDGIWPARLA